MGPRNAVVTGASHGIGGYIARALAARRMNLLLVARSEAELARLARELRGEIKVGIAAVDLGGPQAARQVALAETGRTATTAFSVAPEKVAAAALRAIDKPRAEIVVSLGPGRMMKALMDYFPGLGPTPRT